MKILLLAPQPFYQERGTPIAVNLLARALSARGDEVDLLVYHEGADVSYPRMRLHRIPAPPLVRGVRPGPSVKKLLCDVWFWRHAMRLAEQNRYDLVHAVEEAVWVARAIRRRYGVPYVYDMDSSLAEQITQRIQLPAVVRRRLQALEARAIQEAEAVVAVCDTLADLAHRHQAKQVTILRDISLMDDDVTNDELPSELAQMPSPRVVYIGNLEPYQGIDLLLNSFALAHRHVPMASLAIVGGPWMAACRYQRRASRLGIESSVRWLGPRPVDQMARYLQAADVLVSPRLGGTNTPMKIYSYLHSGKPVLATDLPTHTQVLTPDVAVLAAPTRTAFADGLVRLLTDPGLRRRLGYAGRTLALAQHSRQQFDAAVRQLYHRMDSVVAQQQAKPDQAACAPAMTST